MSTLKLALLAFSAAFAAAAVIRRRSAAPARQQLAGIVSLAAIEEFLTDSRRYLGL